MSALEDLFIVLSWHGHTYIPLLSKFERREPGKVQGHEAWAQLLVFFTFIWVSNKEKCPCNSKIKQISYITFLNLNDRGRDSFLVVAIILAAGIVFCPQLLLLPVLLLINVSVQRIHWLSWLLNQSSSIFQIFALGLPTRRRNASNST